MIINSIKFKILTKKVNCPMQSIFLRFFLLFSALNYGESFTINLNLENISIIKKLIDQTSYHIGNVYSSLFLSKERKLENYIWSTIALVGSTILGAYSIWKYHEEKRKKREIHLVINEEKNLQFSENPFGKNFKNYAYEIETDLRRITVLSPELAALTAKFLHSYTVSRKFFGCIVEGRKGSKKEEIINYFLEKTGFMKIDLFCEQISSENDAFEDATEYIIKKLIENNDKKSVLVIHHPDLAIKDLCDGDETSGYEKKIALEKRIIKSFQRIISTIKENHLPVLVVLFLNDANYMQNVFEKTAAFSNYIYVRTPLFWDRVDFFERQLESKIFTENLLNPTFSSAKKNAEIFTEIIARETEGLTREQLDDFWMRLFTALLYESLENKIIFDFGKNTIYPDENKNDATEETILFDNSSKNTVRDIEYFTFMCYQFAKFVQKSAGFFNDTPFYMQRENGDSIFFGDVLGQRDAKDQLLPHIQFLSNNYTHQTPISQAIVFRGPLGSGKTYLAEALANESGVPFFEIDFSYGYQDIRLLITTMQNVFNLALRAGPSVVFLKNIDHFIDSRASKESYHGFENDSRLNLIVPIITDIQEKNSQILIICSTESAQAINPFISKGVKFDTIIDVTLPNQKERNDLFQDIVQYNSIFFNYLELPEKMDEIISMLSALTNKFAYSEITLFLKRLLHRLDIEKGILPEITDTQELKELRKKNKKISVQEFYSIAYETARDIAELHGKSGFIEKAQFNRILFKDVYGMTDLKKYLEPYVEYIKNHDEYKKNNIRMAKGIILSGPPGVGKTFFAQAFAYEAQVSIHTANASNFFNKYVGGTEQNIEEFFIKIKEQAPCVVLLDEVDAIFSKRRDSEHAEHKNDATNAFLKNLDDIWALDLPIFFICTTNRPDLIDSAIKRSGRIELSFTVDMPSKNERAEIITGLLKKKNIKIDSTISIDDLANMLNGYSPADIESLLSKLQLKMFKDEIDFANNKLLRDVKAEIDFGVPKLSLEISQEELYATAIHESGHYVVGIADKHNDMPATSISIIPRSGTLGVTCFKIVGDKTTSYSENYFAYIRRALGGYIAEKKFLKDTSSGASSDLDHVRDIINRVVIDYAMMGKMFFDKKSAAKESEALCTRLMEETTKIVDSNSRAISQLANELLEKKTMTSEDVERFFASKNIQIVYF